MNDEKFERFLEVLGSEPSLSVTSGMFWVSAVSFLTALAALVLAYYESRRSQRGADAQLILESFQEYEALYPSLRGVSVLADKHKGLLSALSDKLEYKAEAFDIITNFDEIDAEEWRMARKTKLYFKSRFELAGRGFFSDKAIASTMDHAGVNLVRDQLKALDVAMFYQTRQKKFRSGVFKEEYLKRSFEKDLSWYGNVPQFMKKHGTAFGWNA